MDNVLLISGNISRAINSGSLDEIYYLKNPHSDIQSQAIGHEFEILKKYLPSIKRITSINMIPTHKAVTFFGWNACDEVESLKVFKNAKVAKANRLFESVNFEKLKNFKNCEVHMTHIPTPGDAAGLRNLGVNLTSGPNFATKFLFLG